MGTVGAGFAAYQPSIKVTRRPKNPLDKCTIVSVFPLAILDYKPTAFPQTHRIEGAADDDFTITVVETAGWYKEMEEGQPFLEIPITSVQVAEAFIKDYCNGLLGYVPDVSAPGLFFVLGAHTKETIKKYTDPETGTTFAQMLEAARFRQKNWFAELIRIADSDWARTNGNPVSVSETAKLAANKLNLKDKPWIADFQTIEKTNCKACGYLVNPVYPVCPNCKSIVNEARAKELNLKFAS